MYARAFFASFSAGGGLTMAKSLFVVKAKEFDEKDSRGDLKM